MRLRQLRIKNIASLMGEHLIDFRAIEAHGPLFAITGETGSGKSSILNSLGLALYGDIYKSNVTQVDVVTLGEKEGEIQLIFQVAGKNYLADWKARARKQNGELLQKPLIQRQIFQLEGSEFSSPRGEIVESIERLLNLNFDQFCKCIILNQGEFARFLTSSFTERKGILEKLYPGELLDNLGRELKSQLDLLEREKSDLSIKLGELKGENLNGEELKKEKECLKKNLDLHETWAEKLETLDFHLVGLMSAHSKYHETQKRAEHIHQEMARTTTQYNKFLKDSGPIANTLEAAKERQNKDLPRLQELLKTEEALKLGEENLTHQLKRTQDLLDQREKIDRSLQANHKNSEQWRRKQEEELAQFTFEVQDLKKNRQQLERIFDLFSEYQGLLNETVPLEERLRELEAEGKEISTRHQEILDKLGAYPPELKEALIKAENKKLELTVLLERRQKTEIKSLEISKHIQEHQTELLAQQEKIKEADRAHLNLTQEGHTLKSELRLQELSSAIEVCLIHSNTGLEHACPVCTTPILAERWKDLLLHLNKTDAQKVRARYEEVSRAIIQKQEEKKHATGLISYLKDSLDKKAQELAEMSAILAIPLTSSQEIELELKSLQKLLWGQEALTAEEQKIRAHLEKTRESFKKARERSLRVRHELTEKQNTLTTLAQETKGPVMVPISKENIESLKEQTRLLVRYLETEAQVGQLLQEKSFLDKNREKALKDLAALDEEHATLKNKVSEIKSQLEGELKGQSAHALIEKIHHEIREAHDRWAKSEKELKSFELNLKELQSRLYGLNDQLKEYDLIFVKEKHTLREEASAPLPPISEALDQLLLNLKGLTLDFESPPELFVPIKEIFTSEKESLKGASNQLRESHAGISQRLSDWEKRQDKIHVLEMAKADVEERLQRLQRLFTVLGKDELRSFVLSLVEENLIIETNEELQKLCQGRYEIIHQTRGQRSSPEFYILDKFREGGKRKVSTLSGGETFMVSLAMALALAEMTRGQAEIDSLFIDEGFGTLDQDSLEDVLDMLNQIQTRGLMVGIISHIKALTDSLPVNLCLTKKQDGTSSISLKLN